MYHYKTLKVWQMAMDFVNLAYKFTSKFPQDERYSLSCQIKRATVSIPSNIAEGRVRMRGDYKNFLIYAFGSCAEVLTQFEIALNQNYIEPMDYKIIEERITEIIKILTVLIKKEGKQM